MKELMLEVDPTREMAEELQALEEKSVQNNAQEQESIREFLPKGQDKITEIELGGIQVKVKTDATPLQLKQTRELVESIYNDFADKLSFGVSAQQLAVLVAFNLAEDLLREREKMRVFKKQVAESSDRLISRVETYLNK